MASEDRAFPFQPTEVHETENEIAVDIYLDAGDGDAITYVTETVDLGILQPGIYSFSVTLIPGPNTFGGGVSNGGFQVINPVPSVSNSGLVVMIFLVLVSLLIGILARAVPTLNVLEVGFSIRVMVSLFAMFLFAPLLEPAMSGLQVEFISWLDRGLDALEH